MIRDQGRSTTMPSYEMSSIISSKSFYRNVRDAEGFNIFRKMVDEGKQISVFSGVSHSKVL
jgi:hypothetical protein